MSSSDVRAFEELAARVAALEAVSHAPVAVVSREEHEALVQRVAALEAVVLPRDVSGEVYGDAADHAADRAARGRLVQRSPGRLVQREAEKVSELIIPDGPAAA